MKGLWIFRVTQVNSPTDFSLEDVVGYGLAPGGGKWNQFMQTFYSDPANLFRHKLV